MTELVKIIGIHAVMAVLESGPERIHALYLQSERKDKRMNEILALASQHQIRVYRTPKQDLDKMCDSQKHQGVYAKCEPTKYHAEKDIESMLAEKQSPAFILLLDGLQDPHNLGACLRTADAAGVDLVIAPKDRNVSLNETVRRVASGAAEVIPFIQVTNLARCMQQLKDLGIWIYGASDDAPQTVFEGDFTGPIALVLGGEGSGLRRLTREKCDHLVSVPMRGSVSSLNVSVAAGVCLYECVRQRAQ